MRARLLTGALVCMLCLAGCSREPSFDERYAQTEKSIRAKASAIDIDLAERERQASEAAAAASVPSATPAPSAARPRR